MLTTWVLSTLDRAADRGGNSQPRCQSASPRISGHRQGIAAADDILDADEAEAEMEEAVTRGVTKTKSEAREAKRKSTAVVKASAPPKTVPHATATIVSSGPIASSSFSSAANAPSTSTSGGAPRHGCVHFAGSTRFDSRGKKFLAVHCFFGICLVDPLLAQARTSSASSSDMPRGKKSHVQGSLV